MTVELYLRNKMLNVMECIFVLTSMRMYDLILYK